MNNYNFTIMTEEEMNRQPLRNLVVFEWNFAESNMSLKVLCTGYFYGLWNFQNGYLYGSWEIRQYNDKTIQPDMQRLSPMVSELYEWIIEQIDGRIKRMADYELGKIKIKKNKDGVMKELKKFVDDYDKAKRKFEEDYKRTIRGDEKRTRYR